jgi:hypothetical protein
MSSTSTQQAHHGYLGHVELNPWFNYASHLDFILACHSSYTKELSDINVIYT